MPTRERRAKIMGAPVDQLPDGRGKGRKASGSSHYRWSLPRLISDHGYVRVRVGKSHPLADPNGYAYEHLVVWCAAGNARPGEGVIIHHRNGNKTDNRIENLEPMQRAAHAAEHLAIENRRCPKTGRLLPKKAAGNLLDGRQHLEFPR